MLQGNTYCFDLPAALTAACSAARLATSLGTVLRATVEVQVEVEEAATEAEDTVEEDTEEVRAVQEAEVCSTTTSSSSWRGSRSVSALNCIFDINPLST